MTAEEIRAEQLKHRKWFDEFGTKVLLSDILAYMQYRAQMEIAAQFAELNTQVGAGKLSPIYVLQQGGAVDRGHQWQCSECKAIVFSEDHFKRHMQMHEHEDLANDLARGGK